MGFSYLHGGNWRDISREERLYCAHLFYSIQKDVNKFVRLLVSQLQIAEEELKCEWEIGFEVCFYRDFYYGILNKPIKESKYSQKRTFDLCLFSENRIIIIEAKVDQKFKPDQLADIISDKKNVQELIKKPIPINLVSLCSSRYYKNLEKYGDSAILKPFDAKISWRQINELFPEPYFCRAEDIY
jgi:hypothetical protein